ncbi:MAG: T9SS type A sorting domain-containing protein [Saprospiraceae bacterium]|nr:T9SS type A sorting domain-containing protein [Saprospiraceae bacterium]
MMLLDPSLNILDEVTFDAQTTDMGYARVPNGTGAFVIQNPTFNANNESVTGTTTLYEKAPVIRAYPNPAHQTLNLALPDQLAGYKVEVRNVTGQLIHVTPHTTETLSVDVSQWPAGLYVVRCGAAVCSVVVR